MSIQIADLNDVPALVALMDKAYRGENSKQGWTSEGDLFVGTKRTDQEAVIKLMSQPAAVFLKYVDEDDIVACVFLNKKKQRLYLGMFAVSPDTQGKGIGKKMLKAADDYAKQTSCMSIYMTVITVREDLIAWYERNGYKRTDRVLPFPVDERYGVPTQPLEMIVLEKMIV